LLHARIRAHTPIFFFNRIYDFEGTSKGYTFTASVFDLLVLTCCRLATAVIAFLIAFCRGEIRSEYPFDMYHRNGVKKSSEELDEEALEQNFCSWFGRYISRPAFPFEFISLVTTIVCIAKCLVRLNLEVGVLADAEPIHPILWSAILFTSLVSVLEISFLDSVCSLLGEWGHTERERGERSVLRQISSTLSLPLLAGDSLAQDEETGPDTPSNQSGEDGPGVSDIGGDASYKATWTDLLHLCAPDAPLIGIAFIFLLLAAAAQIYIPKFTGAILDALATTFSGSDDDDKTISDVPGFMLNVKLLIVASILGGVFSGLRGSIFTVVSLVTVPLMLSILKELLTNMTSLLARLVVG
jgi:hypothetical protein